MSETGLLIHPAFFNQVMPLKVVKLRVKAHQTRTVPFIRNKEYNRVISVHQSIMVAKTSILSPRIQRPLELTLCYWVICNVWLIRKKKGYLKKDGEDDSESASRGNWWQGSLYY
ncbi:hypothetical protein Patl1_31765 [Pistacia atlantica]|uniref:Uncharacterized protein n=1 Tax=Pistacia atlantica TaxID=434234 RepID=A0ACC1ANH6_9ROSI|nr:hypothetical protein Patl1_31765 [Pistacia atlantica]